jgi:tRNA nucleotidyltransferase/poly(A) polymerase
MNNSFVVEAVRASLGEAYLVGGTIRDSLMGIDKEVDLDFATPLLPDEVKERLQKDGYKVVDFSSRFGTIATTISRVKVEITTFRNEEYEEGSRKPDVKFISSIQEDLARRDFTINAIAHDGNEYIDPFDGQGDIVRRKIKAVGNPAERFSEDPLRILRALRFVSTLGFTLDPATYDAMYDCGHLLARLSEERVSAELDKILAGEHWVQAISLGIETKVFEYLFGVTDIDQYLDDFLESLTNYDHKALPSGRTTRWEIIILSCLASTRSTVGVNQTGKMTNLILSTLQRRLKWPAHFAEQLYENIMSETQKESLRTLEQNLEQIRPDDTRRYIVEEKIYKIKLRRAFADANFNQVSKLAKQLLETQNKNLEVRFSISGDREQSIRDSLKYYLNTLKYLCAAEWHNMATLNSAADVNAATGKIMKQRGIFDLAPFKIGESDRAVTIEDGLLMIMKILPGRVTTLSEVQVLDANKYIPRSRERLIMIKKGFMEELMFLKRPPYEPGVEKKRSKLHSKLAKVIDEIGGGERDYGYYSHVIDMYKWQALSTTSKKEFEKYFASMQEATETCRRSGGMLFPAAIRGFSVDRARCMVHLLSLEDDIEEKIKIADIIIDNYHQAGNAFERHIPRYRLLQDWLTVAQEIISADVSKVKSIRARLIKLPSYNYVDSDEEYVAEHMPEINSIRNNMKDAEALLAVIATGKTDIEIENDETRSIAKLMTYKLIDPSLALAIFKKVLQTQATQDINLEPVSLASETQLRPIGPETVEVENESMALIRQGESDKIEFKQSWSYDVSQAGVPTKEIKKSALKAIVSFMNTSGGTLLIGVSDKPEITGLENGDFKFHQKKSLTRLQLQDELKKDIDNTLHQTIGVASTLVNIDFDYYDDKSIAVLKVKPSNDTVYLENKLYVRSSASCQELQGIDFEKFLRSRAAQT